MKVLFPLLQGQERLGLASQQQPTTLHTLQHFTGLQLEHLELTTQLCIPLLILASLATQATPQEHLLPQLQSTRVGDMHFRTAQPEISAIQVCRVDCTVRKF